MRFERATTFASISCAAIVTATSSGVRAPIWMPIGAWSRARSAWPTPSSSSRAVRSARVFSLPIAPMKPALEAEREPERRHVELEIVGHHADRRARVDRGVLEELVGPLVGELVGVGEPLARQEHLARVAHGDAVAELPADRDERGHVVARAEEVQVRPRRVRLDEDLLAVGGLDDRALADLEQRPRRAARARRCRGVVAVEDRLLAEALVAQAERDGDRLVASHRVGDRRHELRVEPVDRDGDPAAAGEADVEAVLVVEPVVDEPSAAIRSAPRSPRG